MASSLGVYFRDNRVGGIRFSSGVPVVDASVSDVVNYYISDTMTPQEIVDTLKSSLRGNWYVVEEVEQSSPLATAVKSFRTSPFRNRVY
jgi:hypothetical protein